MRVFCCASERGNQRLLGGLEIGPFMLPGFSDRIKVRQETMGSVVARPRARFSENGESYDGLSTIFDAELGAFQERRFDSTQCSSDEGAQFMQAHCTNWPFRVIRPNFRQDHTFPVKHRSV